LSIFTQNYSADTYLGTPFTKIHDFKINTLKAIAFENNMPHVTDCVNAIELFELEVKLGMQQIFLEKTFNKKMAGPITIKDALTNIPDIFATCMMTKFDKPNIDMFYERVATNGTEVFWSHLDTWSAARK
jgi:hypothetical protein